MPAATSGDAGHTRHRGAWLVVVSIGTQIRPQYWRAQRLTWAHGHPFLKFDESDALPCRECPSTLDRRYWWNPNASSSWWCAQKRPLQAIRAAGLRHPSASWFLLVDDDTWVNMITLQGVLRQLELQDQPPQYMGHGAYHGARLLPPVAGSPIRAKMQVMGGAGIVLHRTAVQALLKPRSPSAEDGQPRSGRSLRVQKKNVTELALTDGTSRSLLLKTKSPAAQQEESSSRRSLLDECIEMQVAGRWCWWNSDWAIAECLQMVGIRGVGHSLFAQVQPCHPLSLTCHHVDDVQQKALWARATARWLPCNQTNISNWKRSACSTPYLQRPLKRAGS